MKHPQSFRPHFVPQYLQAVPSESAEDFGENVPSLRDHTVEIKSTYGHAFSTLTLLSEAFPVARLATEPSSSHNQN